MGFFDRIFGRRKPPGVSSAGKRYEYLTANVEFAIRVNAGEPLPAVDEDIKGKWTPGKEYLWDDYDVESLIDSDEKRVIWANQLLYARVTLYRALRSRGRDVTGLDPFRYALEVPEAAQALAEKFPEALDGGRHFQRMDVRPKQPPITGRAAALGDPAVLEGVVREAIGDHFQVDPARIDMNAPLSASPFHADGLDVLELGTDIMERLELPIQERRWEQFLDEETETGPVRVTPAALVQLFREAGGRPGKEG